MSMRGVDGRVQLDKDLRALKDASDQRYRSNKHPDYDICRLAGDLQRTARYCMRFEGCSVDERVIQTLLAAILACREEYSKNILQEYISILSPDPGGEKQGSFR